MTIAMLFALLLQSGACAPVDFAGLDGSTLTILVCPMKRGPDSNQPNEEPT